MFTTGRGRRTPLSETVTCFSAAFPNSQNLIGERRRPSNGVRGYQEHQHEALDALVFHRDDRAIYSTDIEHNFQLVQALKWHYKIVMYSFANFRQHNKQVYDDSKLSI